MQISQFTPEQLIATLISEYEGKPVTTSIIMAEQLSRPHKNVLQSIDALVEDGTLQRGLDAELTFRDVSGPNGAVRQERIYRLSKRSALIAMPFVGGKKSRAGQARLVDAFLYYEAMAKKRDQWEPIRSLGKGMRRDLTDAIADFIGYAQARGAGKGANHYYANFTKLEYKLLFAVASEMPKGFRNLLDVESLETLAYTEKALARHIRREMEKGEAYKDIYVSAKRIAQMSVDILGGRRLLPDLCAGHPPTLT